MVQRKIKIGILIAGLILLALSGYFITRKSERTIIREGLGWIERDFGEIEVGQKGQNRRVQTREIVRPSDSVFTSEEAEAKLQLHDGSELRLLENSQILIEESAGKMLIVIKRGNIRVDEIQTRDQITISKNGQRVLAESYETSPVFSEPTLPDREQISAVGRLQRKPPSEKEISDQFQKQKTALFKCYGQLLQKDPKAKGEISLSFVIQESGKTANLMIQPAGEASSLKDAAFEKCLGDVVSRIQFEAFKGAPVAAIYPLSFE